MDDLYTKLEKLEQSIEKQLKRTKSSVFFSLIVYIALVAFVIMYTTFIMYTIEDVATPVVVAEYLIGPVQDEIPALTEDLSKNSKKYAEMFAKMTIECIRGSIPDIKTLITKHLDSTADLINNEINARCYPIIDEYFKLHKTEILDAFNNMTDQDAAAQIVDQVMNEVDKGMELLSLPAAKSIGKLKADINRLANTSGSKLTKRELAEKRFIAYWMLLLKNEYPDIVELYPDIEALFQ